MMERTSRQSTGQRCVPWDAGKRPHRDDRSPL